jgi:membrane protein required for colicin V production
MHYIDFIWTDYFIIAAMLASIIVGYVRGGTKELLSILSVILNIIVTILVFPSIKSIVNAHFPNNFIAVFLACSIFVIVMMSIFSAINHFCSGAIKRSILGSVDRVVGLVFGAIRGIVVLIAIELAVTQWFVVERLPECMSQSLLRPTLLKISNYMILLLPDEYQNTLIYYMSKMNREKILDFITSESFRNPQINDIINQAYPNKVTAQNGDEKNGDEIPAKESVGPEPTGPKGQTAEELATLKPKQTPLPASKNSKISEKEKQDMSRLLDQNANLENEPKP